MWIPRYTSNNFVFSLRYVAFLNSISVTNLAKQSMAVKHYNMN